MTALTKGVSLIELLIAIVIISVLLSVSWPAYQRFVLRSYRAEATTVLLKLANSQVQYHADFGHFSGDLTRLDSTSLHSARFHFTVQIADSGQTFELSAAAIGPQTADTECARFTLNQLGQRNVNIPNSLSCWQ